MTVKPTGIPRWADVGGAIVDPGAGKKNVGFVTAERPPAQYLNYLLNLHYQWINHINNLLTTGGGVTDNLDTGGNVRVGGDLTLVGDNKHGDRTLELTAIGAYSANVSYDTANAYSVNTGTGTAAIPIPLRVGDRIKSITTQRYGNVAAFSNTVAVFKKTAAHVVSIPAGYTATYTTPNTAAWTTNTITPGTPVAIAAGEYWWLEMTFSAAATRLGGFSIVYDRP